MLGFAFSGERDDAYRRAILCVFPFLLGQQLPPSDCLPSAAYAGFIVISHVGVTNAQRISYDYIAS